MKPVPRSEEGDVKVKDGLSGRTALGFNKACEIDDFKDAQLAASILEVCRHKLAHFPAGYPIGFEYNKDWEVGMAVRTLKHFGALRPDSLILGVAAGKEDTLFYLTRHARFVFATDRYLHAREWESLAPLSMMIEPSRLAPFEFDPNRLIVQHMDARVLRYPDNTFDGIFSSGSIEHFGELEDIAAAAFEMGRVLKPGGIASISTVLKCSGPEGYGWPGLTVIMSKDLLMKYIVQASGLELVDDLDVGVSEETLASTQDLVQCQAIREERVRQAGSRAAGAEFAHWDFPHITLSHEGYIFNSVHLALRKAEHYPVLVNAWAAPSSQLAGAIALDNVKALEAIQEGPRQDYGSSAKDAGGTVIDDGGQDPVLASAKAFIDEVRRARSVAAGVALGAEGAGCLSIAHQRGGESLFPVAWRPINVRPGLNFELALDPRASDPFSLRCLGSLAAVDLPAPVQFAVELIEPGHNVMDIGASFGVFALAAAAVGANVCALEASPNRSGNLRAAAVRNGFFNLKCLRVLVGRAAGEDSSFVDDLVDPVPAGSAAAPSLRADDLFRELGWSGLDLMRVDLDQLKSGALEGMRWLLSEIRPLRIFIDTSDRAAQADTVNSEDFMQELTRLGYECHVMPADGESGPAGAGRPQSGLLLLSGDVLNESLRHLPKVMAP